MALALASLLSLERMFERDLEDGALDLLATGPLPLEATVGIKAVAQWLATGLPLALAAPVAALALGQPPELIVLTGVSAALDSADGLAPKLSSCGGSARNPGPRCPDRPR